MTRWIGFPVRCFLYALAMGFVIPLAIVFWPAEWDWYEIRKDWHRWVLQDRDWREVKKKEAL